MIETPATRPPRLWRELTVSATASALTLILVIVHLGTLFVILSRELSAAPLTSLAIWMTVTSVGLAVAVPLIGLDLGPRPRHGWALRAAGALLAVAVAIAGYSMITMIAQRRFDLGLLVLTSLSADEQARLVALVFLQVWRLAAWALADRGVRTTGHPYDGPMGRLPLWVWPIAATGLPILLPFAEGAVYARMSELARRQLASTASPTKSEGPP